MDSEGNTVPGPEMSALSEKLPAIEKNQKNLKKKN
jgi:hypothetical protein